MTGSVFQISIMVLFNQNQLRDERVQFSDSDGYKVEPLAHLLAARIWPGVTPKWALRERVK